MGQNCLQKILVELDALDIWTGYFCRKILKDPQRRAGNKGNPANRGACRIVAR